MFDRNWRPSHAAPARDVRKKRFGKSLVYFPSRKNHVQLICESHNEAYMCWLLEYQHHVTQYYIQPVSYRYDPTKKSCQYTPDFFVQCDDGHAYFIELKGSLSELSSHYHSVLDSFATAAAMLGYGFETFNLAEFAKDGTLDNLALLYSRSHRVTDYEQRQLMSCLCTWTGPLSISLLLSHESHPSLRAICAAIFDQQLNFDLRNTLTLNTPLFKPKIQEP
jgi:hypothetical protein